MRVRVGGWRWDQVDIEQGLLQISRLKNGFSRFAPSDVPRSGRHAVLLLKESPAHSGWQSCDTVVGRRCNKKYFHSLYSFYVSSRFQDDS